MRTFLMACLLAGFSTTTAVAEDREIPMAGLFPVPKATAMAPDTPLRLTFDAPPTLGRGRLTVVDAPTQQPVETVDLAAEKVTRTIGTIANFNTRPAVVEGNTVHIFLSKPLAYDSTYFVILDPGTVASGVDTYTGINNPGAWRFSTKKSPPEKGVTRLTVAADGSGDFATLQGALDFIPENNNTATTILLKKGIYREIVAFTNKHRITIQGEDRKETILKFANNANFNNQGSPYRRGLFIAHRCNDLVIANMTFHNTTPRGGSQAESLILNGTPTSRAILTDLDLVSFQDTLQINGQAYIQNSYIEGDVDFMWGNGPCFLLNVQCKSTRSGAYFTQIRNPATNRGYVFNKCTFTGSEGITNNVVSRIDPVRFAHSEVVLIDCTMDEVVSPAAWRLDNLPPPADQNAVNPATYPTIHFWEFNSRTPGGQAVDTSKRHPISRQLRETEDAELIRNYRNPTWVLGNEWVPKVPALFDK
jgi:pectin methylesterase-like acyl-CoA thioesterase